MASSSLWPFWHPKRHPVIFGVLLAAFSLSQALALVTFDTQSYSDNILGLFGYFSAYTLYALFGPLSFLAVLAVGLLSVELLQGKDHHCSRRYVFAMIGVLYSLSMLTTLLAVLQPSVEVSWRQFLHASKDQLWIFRLGGIPAAVMYSHLPYLSFERLFSVIGTALLSSTALFVSLIILFDIDISLLWSSSKGKRRVKEEKEEELAPVFEEELVPAAVNAPERSVKFGIEAPPELSIRSRRSQPSENVWTAHENPPPPNLASYQLPSPELLNLPKKVDVSELKKELKDKADLLEATLLNFGIEAKVGQIHCGPTITSFEVHPAVGVKVGKIKTLEHDIALNMEAKSIRIIAPIPGKAAVGIEIPNASPQEVNFREVLAAYQQRGSPFKIPMLLGKAVNGDLVLTDLAKMPHIIIAGATGSGKSVCINSIVVSILMLARPDEIRFVMVDPKKVELAAYTELPHMITPVITESHSAAAALNWLVREMEKRYEILRITGQRNIDAFNKRTPNKEVESASHIQIPEKLFYIVGIVDELADLMMVASGDVEAPIARIAQMARAVGIHLILATQRPSREVITGLIKANFPARIAFKVASRVNSQIILDDIGAETLLGNGDMLILLPGSSQPIRAQGVFVRDEEITKVINAITSQQPPNYLIGSMGALEAHHQEGADDVEFDDLFEEAKQTVFSTGNASTTFLQRKLKIGYARAASIMDQLEMQGIVGPQEGAKPRRINFPKGMNPTSDNSYDEREDNT